MKPLALLAGVAALSSVALADPPRYSLAELKALVAQRSYPEAVSHLSDISPAERKADWLAVAVDAASGYVGGLAGDDLATKIWSIEAIDAQYPQLLTQPRYTKVRAEIGLRGYDACFARSEVLDACLEHATRFLDADASNTELAFKLAKVLRRSSNPDISVPFFKRAVAGKPSAAMCKDDALQSAVLAGLGLPADHDRAADARAIASGACFDPLKPAILEALDAEVPGGPVHGNACALMKGRRALDATQTRSCDKKKS
jgi:hypothetical protein